MGTSRLGFGLFSRWPFKRKRWAKGGHVRGPGRYPWGPDRINVDGVCQYVYGADEVRDSIPALLSVGEVYYENLCPCYEEKAKALRSQFSLNQNVTMHFGQTCENCEDDE